MTSYKYVTSYWRDSQEVYGNDVTSNTGTKFHILNYDEFAVKINIYFFDVLGNLIPEIQVEMVIPSNGSLTITMKDILHFTFPEYKNTAYKREGSLKIVCDKPLVISGKSYKGSTDTFGAQKNRNVWSIPFEEVQLEPLDLPVYDPKKPLPFPNNDKPDFGNFNRRRIDPRPR